MIFLNYDLCGDKTSIDGIIPASTNITDVTMSNAVVDELYVSKNIEYDMSSIPQEWDYETILHALFNENIAAGNVGFLLDEVSLLRLKRRESGTYEWITLAEFPINAVEDFNISYIDRYANASTTYEYALVAVSDANIEGSSNAAEVESKFDGVMIAEKDMAYRAFLYDYTPTERNQLTSVVTTLHSKYPFIIKNSIANYTSGQIHAAFLPISECFIEHDYVQDSLYREAFTDFLTNGNPKLLKLDDGRSWIVNIIDNVSHNENNGILYTDFSFVETGDANNNQDLYDANLVDATDTVSEYIEVNHTAASLVL